MRKHLYNIITLLTLTLTISAQAEERDSTLTRFEYGIDYTGELQTDFGKGFNFVNLLRLDGRLNVTDRLHLDVATLTALRTNDHIVPDLQVFSNLVSPEQIPLTLAVAGLTYELPTRRNSHTLFFGVRNTGEDYFASPLTAFFANSSCGIYPTLSANFPIATYPYAAMALHYEYDSRHWGAKATIYNGEGRYRFGKGESLFRIDPMMSGLFCMAQAEYKHEGSSYFLGGSLYKDSPTLWAYAEQQAFSNASCSLQLIGCYAYSPTTSSICPHFAGIGGKLTVRKIEIGLFTDYADFGGLADDTHHHEFATELTCQIPIGKYVYLKPALHYINGTTTHRLVGAMRFGFCY